MLKSNPNPQLSNTDLSVHGLLSTRSESLYMKRGLYKITRDVRLWKRGQKVWHIFGTGALASYVVGKYRGGGRWIRAWVHLEGSEGKGFFCKPDARYIGDVEISKQFNKYLEDLSGRNVRSSMSDSV